MSPPSSPSPLALANGAKHPQHGKARVAHRLRQAVRLLWRGLPVSEGEWLCAAREYLEKEKADVLGNPIHSLRLIEPLPTLLQAQDGRRYRYFKVQKAACTSIVTALLQASDRAGEFYPLLPEEVKTLNFAGWVSVLGRTRRIGINESGLRAEVSYFYPFHAFAPEPMADIRFCVVREPVARFLSAFHNVVGTHQLYDKTYRVEEFLEQLEATKAYAYDPLPPLYTKERIGTFARDIHFRPQCFSLGEQPDYYTHIFSMAELPKLAELLSDLAGKPITLPHLNPDQQGEGIGKALRQRIADYYAQDYKVFGRFFAPEDK